MKIRAQWQPWYSGIALLMSEHRNGKTYTVCPVSLKEVSDHCACEPTMDITKEEAQGLVDDLYACGFRPSSGEHTTGQLAATEKHLEDMRKIAFKYIGE